MPVDLRAHLVATGVELVNAEGPAALSLREIARRAGVSHGAPRRYFPSHRDLLAAVARVGYDALSARIAALGEQPDPRAGLLALGRLYLEFARTDRGMFELMFRHELLRGNHEGLRTVSRPLFRLVVTPARSLRCSSDCSMAILRVGCVSDKQGTGTPINQYTLECGFWEVQSGGARVLVGL